MTRGFTYLLLGAAMGAGAVLAGGVVRAAVTPSGAEGLALFKQVFEKVRENDFYVDAPDGSKMVESAIGGMLASLDPHSTYFDPKALNEFQTTMKGEEFGGLGLEVMQDEGLVRVVSPIDDTPAARAGMLSGDLITKIDDTPVQGLSLKEAVDRMRGTAKTSVRLTVSRGEGKDVKEFNSEAQTAQDPNLQQAIKQDAAVLAEHQQAVEQVAQTHNITLEAKK